MRVLPSCARATAFVESPEAAMPGHDRAVELARAVGDPYGIAFALSVRGQAHVDVGRTEEALRDLSESLELESGRTATLTAGRLEAMIDSYYRGRGLDEAGVPSPETVSKLSLRGLMDSEPIGAKVG